jgi:hypothetical protein
VDKVGIFKCSPRVPELGIRPHVTKIKGFHSTKKEKEYLEKRS